MREIPIGQIRPNQHQPRKHFDEEAMSSLAASIKELGILQPVLVRETTTEQFELIAGERRWRAARRAGLQSVPALVQTTTDVSSLEQALVENLHREDLNPLEEAAAYQQLIEDFGITHEELARRVGKSRAGVTNSLRLFQLPPSVQRLVSDGLLSAGHARTLLGTPDREAQERLAAQIVEHGWSVRTVEEAVRAIAPVEEAPADDLQGVADGAPDRNQAPAVGARKALRPPGVLELEELLANHLSTRVHVDMRAKRGKVVIEFATLEDLERIYRIMISDEEIPS
ncbi:MAG TPA: ParB/RepB/Spo0J family partition protein [Acidimicrobiales bacterium]|nr:ParB/RepB/Spo0J family partition protein [Acidimicrobiales bacterium]